MEELRQRLVAETTLTPEQVAIAIKVISPYQQEELLQLPSSELEAKTRALAAIPSARPLSLRRQGAPLGAPAAAPPQAAPATPPPAPSIGLKRPNSSATASGLVAPQGPTLVPPASKLVTPQLLAPAAALVAPQGSQLLAPAAPLVAPQEAAPVAADVPPEPPPAPEEAKKSYSYKAAFTPQANGAATEIAARSPLAIVGFAAAMMLTVTLVAWGLSHMPKTQPSLDDLLEDAASGAAGDPDIEVALRPEGGSLKPIAAVVPADGSKMGTFRN